MIPLRSAPIRLTEAEKQSYIRSKDGRGPSATGPRNGPQRKIQPIVVPLPRNIGPLANYTDRAFSQPYSILYV
jgi:hypothetical protein